MLHKSRSDVKRGFTLIELLVVIAIISILAAILFPVFARARENARRASCQSNLKQLALGMMQYTQDYDEKFPGYAGDTNTCKIVSTNCAGWAFTVQPYVKSVQVLQCPSVNVVLSTDSGNGNYSTYADNLALGYNQTTGVSTGTNLAVLTQPSVTVMLCDYVPWFSASWASGTGYGNSTTGTSGALAKLYKIGDNSSTAGNDRHLNGANFAYTDGHVKWSKMLPDGTVMGMYQAATPGSVSGSSPTFNLAP
jgi:prepilin-type N-terminal cleavage/methylation domain-containing protein/prepilin-type processing-associated H-X9-DG protein